MYSFAKSYITGSKESMHQIFYRKLEPIINNYTDIPNNSKLEYWSTKH